ncbi:MAG: ATP-binding cassette domain-containing protein [Actinobacteria bacterium]|nr:ATP-binding cassette domain-containing protein [Actinomycetota bacterium]
MSDTALPRTADNSLLADRADGTRVQFDGIVKSYGRTTVLHGIDLDIAPGEFVSLLGPSGCGKTTLLRVLAGLESADGGAVLLGGKDVSGVPTNKRDLGMVFQSYSLFPHLRVVDNTAFGLRRRKVPTAEARRRALDALALVGLEAHADKFPHQLSGGQRQRVNIARAIAVRPQVLLADEPTSMLDVSIRQGILDLLAGIKRERNLALLYITHDIATAAHVAEEIVVMFAGQMVEWGDALAVITNPRHPYTKLLLSAVPDPNRPFIPGQSGAFLRRAEDIRRISRPASNTVEQAGPNHFVRMPGSADHNASD